MRKITLFVIIAAMLCSSFLFTSCASAAAKDLETIKEKGVIRIGMECDYAPFNWTQTEASDFTAPITSGGYADGYDIQIAKMVAEGLGVRLEIVKTAWDGLIPALTSGEIDAVIAGMSPTAERKATIDFTDNYYKSELVVVVLKNSAFASAASIKDFSGAKITGQLSTFHYSVIDQMTGAIKQTALESFPAMIAALQAKSIDGYISELPGAVSAAAANSDITYVEFAENSGFVTSDDDVAVAVGIRKGSSLAEAVNTILSGISEETRIELMNAAVARQPVNEE